MLNRRKGPAVWGPRAQIDRGLYRRHLQKELLSTPGLELLEASVDDLMLSDGERPGTATCTGVRTGEARETTGWALRLWRAERVNGWMANEWREIDYWMHGNEWVEINEWKIINKMKMNEWKNENEGKVNENEWLNGEDELISECMRVFMSAAETDGMLMTGVFPPPPTPPSCRPLSTGDGRELTAASVVLTAGTFLRGQISIGTEQWPAGRAGDQPAVQLARALERLQFRMGRLKTGVDAHIGCLRARDKLSLSYFRGFCRCWEGIQEIAVVASFVW